MTETKNKQKRNGEIVYTNGEKEVIEYGITIITENTFRKKRDFVFNQKDIAAIVLPNSVETIGKDAFYRYSKLESIEIPNSVTEIQDTAFSECNMLKSVEIPNSVRLLRGFSYCTSLESVRIPYSVNEIDADAFLGCTSLQSIDIPGTVSKINGNPFGGTSLKINLSPENAYFKVVDGNLYTIDGEKLIS